MDTVFGLFRVEPDAAPDATHLHLDIRQTHDDSGWTFTAFEQPIYSIQHERQIVPATESLVTHLFTRLQRSLFVLHTGLVEWNGHGILIPGERGSGKSTLTLWLARNGARYFGDDLILFDFQAERVIAFPKAATLKQGSFPCYEEAPTYEDPVRGPVRYFLPESAGLHDMPLANLKLIVFPQYIAVGAKPSHELSEGWSALALVQQLFGGFDWDDRGLSLIARLSKIPARVLPYSDLHQAQRQITEALETEAPHALS